MSQLNIQVIDTEFVDIPKKKGNGTYGQLTVTYKGDDGQVKAKKLLDFATPKDVINTLSKATKGDTFAITQEKNDAGYWDWTEIATQTMPVGKPAAAAAAPTRSNYETPEERAQRQVYIIKQSSIASAVELLKHKDPSPEDVVKAAQVFVDYVMAARVQDMTDDIPF